MSHEILKPYIFPCFSLFFDLLILLARFGRFVKHFSLIIFIIFTVSYICDECRNNNCTRSSIIYNLSFNLCSCLFLLYNSQKIYFPKKNQRKNLNKKISGANLLAGNECMFLQPINILSNFTIFSFFFSFSFSLCFLLLYCEPTDNLTFTASAASLDSITNFV